MISPLLLSSFSSSFFTLWLFFVLSPQTGGPPSENVHQTGNDSIARQVQEPDKTILYFPDYVDGGGWSVQLVISNADPDAAAEVRVDVYDPDGQPVRDLFDSDLTLEIPALGSRVLRSAGPRAIRRGWIQVETESATVSGLLTYRHGESGIEVGIEPVEPGNHFALFVEESSEIGTGLAIFKPDGPPEIEVRIRNEEGSDPIGQILKWGDFQQQARTLPEWFEDVDTKFLRDFRGLLFLGDTDGSDFAPLGLRFGKQKGSLSAVPVIPIRDAGAGKMYWTDVETAKIQRANLDGSGVEDLVASGLSGPKGVALDLVGGYQIQEPLGTVLYFPDYVEGGGWSVQLVLSNVSATAATAVVEVYGQDGGSVTDLFDSGSTVEIPSLGSRILRSTGGGAIRRGWIGVRSEPGSVSGLLTYRHVETGIEVGVQPIEPGRQFAMFVEETSEIGTGLAIFKPEASSEIELQIRDEAGMDPIGEVFTRGNFHQRALTLPEWLEGTDPQILRDFRGLLILRSPDDSEFAPLGLRFGKQKGSLSAVPVIPIRDPGGGKLYWALFDEDDTGKIQRANLDGSGVQDLVNLGSDLPTGLALDPSRGKLYWALYDEDDTGKIQRANLDGSGVEDLVTSGLSTLINLALDPGGGKLYWMRFDEVGTGKIQRANLDGSQVEDLLHFTFSGDSPPIGLALDPSGGKLYWTLWDEDDKNKIQRANLDGSGVQDLVNLGRTVPGSLALDPGGGKLYWALFDEDDKNKIQRANLDGSGVQDLVNLGRTVPFSLALDPGGGKLYWALLDEDDMGKIQRANLDGSQVEDLVTTGQLWDDANIYAFKLALGLGVTSP